MFDLGLLRAWGSVRHFLMSPQTCAGAASDSEIVSAAEASVPLVVPVPVLSAAEPMRTTEKQSHVRSSVMPAFEGVAVASKINEKHGIQHPPSLRNGTRRAHLHNFARSQKRFIDTCDATAVECWYLVLTATLLAFHHEDLTGELWLFLSTRDTNPQNQLSRVRRIREACLKCSVLVGFPRAINALSALQTSISSHSPELLPFLENETSLRSPLPYAAKLRRGEEFFAKLYQQHTERILSSLAQTSGGEMNHFALACVYGELMAEVSIVSDVETVILEFVCCLGDSVGRQAKGHFYGSRNMKASLSTLAATVDLMQDAASFLGVPCSWDGDEFRFLDQLISYQDMSGQSTT